MTHHLQPFAVPFNAPLVLGGRTHTERRGVLLRVEMDGFVGWGEASPLPGFSPDSLDEVQTALAEVEGVLPDAYEALRADPAADLSPWRLPPAAQAAVEGALLSLIAHKRGTAVAHLLNPEASETVVVNGLMPHASWDETIERAHDLARAGYRAVKLKVGQRAVELDADLTRTVAEALGPHVALRLDANRMWTRADALRFAEMVASVPIAYIEEPVADAADLPLVAEHLPIALDESLVGQSPEFLDLHPHARAVILKPMLLGGIASAWRWARAARQRDLAPVVSAAFESGIGTRLNVALAAALGGDVPAGLDPYRWIARDVLPQRLPLDGPVVSAAI